MKKARAPRLEPTWHCTYEVIIKNMFDQKFVHNAASLFTQPLNSLFTPWSGFSSRPFSYVSIVT